MENEQETIEGELVNQPKAELVQYTRDPQLELIAQALGAQSSLEVGNFDGDPMRQWELASLASAGEAIKSSEVINQVIEFKYVYMHGVIVRGKEAGELIECVRTVLIDDKGVCYAFVSAGVAMDCVRMLVRFGRKPFVPAMKVKVVQRPTQSGNSILRLIYVPPAS